MGWVETGVVYFLGKKYDVGCYTLATGGYIALLLFYQSVVTVGFPVVKPLNRLMCARVMKFATRNNSVDMERGGNGYTRVPVRDCILLCNFVEYQIIYTQSVNNGLVREASSPFCKTVLVFRGVWRDSNLTNAYAMQSRVCTSV